MHSELLTQDNDLYLSQSQGPPGILAAQEELPVALPSTSTSDVHDAQYWSLRHQNVQLRRKSRELRSKIAEFIDCMQQDLSTARDSSVARGLIDTLAGNMAAFLRQDEATFAEDSQAVHVDLLLDREGSGCSVQVRRDATFSDLTSSMLPRLLSKLVSQLGFDSNEPLMYEALLLDAGGGARGARWPCNSDVRLGDVASSVEGGPDYVALQFLLGDSPLDFAGLVPGVETRQVESERPAALCPSPERAGPSHLNLLPPDPVVAVLSELDRGLRATRGGAAPRPPPLFNPTHALLAHNRRAAAPPPAAVHAPTADPAAAAAAAAAALSGVNDDPTPSPKPRVIAIDFTQEPDDAQPRLGGGRVQRSPPPARTAPVGRKSRPTRGTPAVAERAAPDLQPSPAAAAPADVAGPSRAALDELPMDSQQGGAAGQSLGSHDWTDSLERTHHVIEMPRDPPATFPLEHDEPGPAHSPAPRGTPPRRPLSNKRQRQNDEDDPIEDVHPQDPHAAAPPQVAASPRRGRGRRLPPTVAPAPAAAAPVPQGNARFDWSLENTILLLDGMEKYGTSWAKIQEEQFPIYRGTGMQSKFKDKWRVLCAGLHKRDSVRKHLPESVWRRIATLSRLYPVKP